MLGRYTDFGNATNRNNPISNSFVGWWIPSQVNKARQVLDLTTNKRNLAFNGGVTYSPVSPKGRPTNSMISAAAADFLSYPSNPLTGLVAFSAWGWIRTSNVAFNGSTIFTCYDNAIGDGFFLEQDAASPCKIQFRKRTSYTDKTAVANAGMANNTWYFALGTCDLSGLVTLYINGIPQTTTASGSTAAITNTSALNVGVGVGSRDILFAEWGIANRGFTAWEAMQLYVEALGDYPNLRSQFSRRAKMLKTSGSATYNVSVAESMTLAETPTATAVMNDSRTESMTLADAETGVAVYPVAIAESMTLAETETATQTFPVAIAESMTLADTVTAIATMGVAITEAMTLSESESALFVYNDSRSESMTLSDAETATVAYVVTIAESMTLTDTPTATATMAVAITESMSLVEMQSADGAIYNVSIAESISLAETSSAAALFTVSITEAMTLLDSSSAVAVFPVSISESMNLIEVETSTAVMSVAVTEAMVLTEVQTSPDTAENIEIFHLSGQYNLDYNLSGTYALQVPLTGTYLNTFQLTGDWEQ